MGSPEHDFHTSDNEHAPDYFTDGGYRIFVLAAQRPGSNAGKMAKCYESGHYKQRNEVIYYAGTGRGEHLTGIWLRPTRGGSSGLWGGRRSCFVLQFLVAGLSGSCFRRLWP